MQTHGGKTLQDSAILNKASDSQLFGDMAMKEVHLLTAEALTH